MFKGIAVSKGIGIGKVMLIKYTPISYEDRKIVDTATEIRRLANAIGAYSKAVEMKAQKVMDLVGEQEAEIISAKLLMLADPYVKTEMENRIKSGSCAESSVETVLGTFESAFMSTGDDLTMQRAADVRDLRDGLLRILLNLPEPDIAGAAKGTVLVAKEITPSMSSEIDKDNIVAVIAENGGYTSHSAILARAMGIPAVLSVNGATGSLQDGDEVIVDGSVGTVIINPTSQETLAYGEKRDDFIRQQKTLKVYFGKETLTADGVKTHLFANIGNDKEASIAAANDAEGIGLFRTEFLYMLEKALPSEEVQFEAYKLAAMTMKNKPLIIRTLDIGGDKDIPYLKLEKEDNPFLGHRAIRYCLDRPDVFRPQLRALLRASAYGDIRIMLPLITCVEEVRAAKVIVDEMKEELRKKEIDFNDDIQIGIMAETAASFAIADLLAREADFFSIGTNDLTQYMMEADRGNEKTARLCSAYHPAVLRAIRGIILAAKKAKIEVGMCGESASDLLLHPLLISFGLDEYSVSPNFILSTRRSLSLWGKTEADKVTKHTMSLATEKEVREYLESVRKD